MAADLGAPGAAGAVAPSTRNQPVYTQFGAPRMPSQSRDARPRSAFCAVHLAYTTVQSNSRFTAVTIIDHGGMPHTSDPKKRRLIADLKAQRERSANRALPTLADVVAQLRRRNLLSKAPEEMPALADMAARLEQIADKMKVSESAPTHRVRGRNGLTDVVMTYDNAKKLAAKPGREKHANRIVPTAQSADEELLIEFLRDGKFVEYRTLRIKYYDDGRHGFSVCAIDEKSGDRKQITNYMTSRIDYLERERNAGYLIYSSLAKGVKR